MSASMSATAWSPTRPTPPPGSGSTRSARCRSPGPSALAEPDPPPPPAAPSFSRPAVAVRRLAALVAVALLAALCYRVLTDDAQHAELGNVSPTEQGDE